MAAAEILAGLRGYDCRKVRAARFIAEYLIDCNATEAAIRAGYSTRCARMEASRLLADPLVQKALAAERAALSRRTGITAEMVLGRLWMIATADPCELVEQRRACCRYCYGKGHRYQFTRRERDEAELDAERSRLAAMAKGDPSARPFDEQGGVGFNRSRDPHPACPECFGEGIEQTYFKDTRDLTPAARALYAGMKITGDSMTVKMQDQAAALIEVGRMFRTNVTHSNDAVRPLPSVVIVASVNR